MHDTESDTSAIALSLLGLAYILVKRKFKNNRRCVCAHEDTSDAYPENGECTSIRTSVYIVSVYYMTIYVST